MNATSLETIDADVLEAATGGASKPSEAARQAELTKMLTPITDSIRPSPPSLSPPRTSLALPVAPTAPTPVPDTIPYAK